MSDTPEMVERVARAIWFEDAPEDEFDDVKLVYTEIARAAIKAMREPTKAMLDAGDIGDWDTMIDAALEAPK